MQYLPRLSREYSIILKIDPSFLRDFNIYIPTDLSMDAYFQSSSEQRRARRGVHGQQQASFSSQQSRRVRTRPRTRSPIVFRNQRPRAPRPPTTPASTSLPSRGRARADYAQRAARYLFDFALARYTEQQHHRTSSRANPNETTHQSHGGSVIGHAVTGILLEQLTQEIIEYLVRHNFFRARSTSVPRQQEQSREVDTGTQTSQSSTEHRRRHRRNRSSEVMMTSLDRLSSELETTYDTLVRLLRDPDSNPPLDETLRENASDLRRAITRCMARVESVQTRSRRNRRLAGRPLVEVECTGEPQERCATKPRT